VRPQAAEIRVLSRFARSANHCCKREFWGWA
jgi:hypothetical protein